MVVITATALRLMEARQALSDLVLELGRGVIQAVDQGGLLFVAAGGCGHADMQGLFK